MNSARFAVPASNGLVRADRRRGLSAPICAEDKALGRCIAAALGAVCVLASPVMAVEPSNFNATTTRDLVALCSDEPGDALYAEAKQFCYGFLAGVAQFHRSVVIEDGLKPIACPKQEVTRAQLVGAFLDWAKANPGSTDELPVASLRRAAAAKWSCESSPAASRPGQ
jgi:hypothetical protein